jgi:hypothetical protein
MEFEYFNNYFFNANPTSIDDFPTQTSLRKIRETVELLELHGTPELPMLIITGTPWYTTRSLDSGEPLIEFDNLRLPLRESKQ